MGDSLYNIAVVWVAVKLAGGDAGLIAAAQSAATLVFALPAGALADRWNRRRTMIAADLLRAAVVGVMPLLASHGALTAPLLIGASVFLGALNALFVPAMRASLPTLAKNPTELRSLTSLVDATFRIARAVAPSFAGMLAARLSILHFFTFDSISFVISAGAIFSLGARYAWQPPASTSRMTRDIVDAGQTLWRHTGLTWMFAAVFVLNFWWSGAFTIGAALFADRVLGQSDALGNTRRGIDAYGFIVASYGAGNIAGNLIASAREAQHPLRTYFTSKLWLAFGFLIFAWAPSLTWAMAGVAVAALGGPLGEIPLLAVMQRDLPSGTLGRAFGVRMILEQSGISLGLVASAPLYHLLPVRYGIAVCAGGILLLALVGAWRFRSAVDGG